MTWYRKEASTPFDQQPIEGLHFLDGNLIGILMSEYFLDGQKCPIVEFPSGFKCEIWEPPQSENMAILHLFGEIDIPYGGQTRDEAFECVMEISDQNGYSVQKVGENQLDLRGFGDDEHCIVTYDNTHKYILDIVRKKNTSRERPIHPAHILMTDEIRQQLPPLYSTDGSSWDTEALVKYFHPLSQWTWYPIEFDGEDIFFGLVIGYEIELGTFSLSELQSIGKDGKTVPIERDLYFTPQTLRDLKTKYSGI